MSRLIHSYGHRGLHRKSSQPRVPSMPNRSITVCYGHGLLHCTCGIRVKWEGI